jgi:hypothetical protein
MSAVVAPSTTDRSDLRTVLTGGTKLGVGTAVTVVLYLASAKYVPAAGGVRAGVEALLVLATGSAVAFLPGTWSVARNVEGIAGAAATGLWGTIVFSILDIALLRPLGAYPWTWDAVGGGTIWWYLPMWWILGTFLAWMGGARLALGAAHGRSSVLGTVGPVLLGGAVVAGAVKAAAAAMLLPVAVGVGFAVSLLALVLVALARRT